MTGRDPMDELHELAEAGERAARPSPPEEIRARGNRRGRRRRAFAATGALAFAILAGVLGGSVVTQTGVLPNVPNPAGTPSSGTPSSAPPSAMTAPPLTADNMPTETDLEWDNAGDWKIKDEYLGSGPDVPSKCLQASPDSLGPDRSFFYTYDFDGQFGSATALEFGSEDEAKQAYETFTRWSDECEQTLRELGHQSTRAWDWVEVETEHGEAKYRVISADQLDDPKSELSTFEEYGLILAGDRVEIVTMQNLNTEHHWATEPDDETGFDLDPMIRSLPKAAARLVGDPMETTPSEVPTASPTLTDDNLVRPGDLPEYEGLQAEEYSRNARPGLRPSTCFVDSLDSLGATDSLTRSFRYTITNPNDTPDTSDPLYEQPTIYTVALEFGDEDQAAEAYDAISGWVEDCATALDNEGFRAPGGGPVQGFDRWYPVRGNVETAQFTEFMYQRADMLNGNGYFEGVGLVRTGDRIAIAITLTYGMDSNWDTDPDAGVAGPHPLADILPVAAKRLAG